MMLDICLVSDGLIPALESLDKQLLLEVNGSDSLYLDRVAHKLTNALAWIPFYISLFYVVLKNNDSFRKILLVLGAVSVCVLLAGMVDDMIVKPTVARWRPTHDPEIGPLVDVVDGYRGGKYGFFSAHAANTFSIAIFLCWMVGSFAYFLFYRLTRRINQGRHLISLQYTSTGYQHADCDIPVAVLVFTLLIILIISCIL